MIRERNPLVFAAMAVLGVLIAACSGGGGGGGGSGDGGGPTPVAPTAVTVEASSTTVSAATLNGLVYSNGSDTLAWFEWGTRSDLPNSNPTTKKSVGAGTTPQSIVEGISGLAQGTTYYFRVIAANTGGTANGAIASFTTATPNSQPTVATHAATSVTETGAQLNGSVIPNGLATDAWFEWGTSPTLGTFATTDNQSIGGGIVSVPINYNLTGLTAGQTYYFRAAAANSKGTVNGVIASFRAKTVYWSAPQSFTDNTPLVPSRDLQGYEIYIKPNPSFGPGDSPVGTASALDTTYILENVSPPLLNGVTYYVSLRTVTVDNVKSDFSQPFSFSP